MERNRLALDANTYAMTHQKQTITVQNQTGGSAIITAAQVRH